MNSVMLVESITELESIYALNLQLYVGVEEIISKKKAEFAIQYLEDKGIPPMIIARESIDGEETAKLLLNYISSKNIDTTLIVIGKENPPTNNIHFLSSALDLKPIIMIVAQTLGVTAHDMANKVVPTYFPIPITYFTVLNRAVCEVFVEKVDHPGEYAKVIEENAIFTQDFIQNLIRQGNRELFVHKDHRLTFVNNVSAEIINKIDIEMLNKDEQIQATESTSDLLAKKLELVGVTEETVQLANKNMKQIAGLAKKNKKLSYLLEDLLRNRSSFRYRKIMILSYIAIHMMKHIDWGTPEQEAKLSFIAFYHDIFLTSDDEVMIKSKKDLRDSDLSGMKKTIVDKHASMAAELVSQIPKAPMGIDTIIRQHHGNMNGIGFSEHYGANISPLAIVFIIAEDFARELILDDKARFNKGKIIRTMKERYPTARFAKIIDALDKVTI